MRINIVELLEYFDIRETTSNGDTTAAISVVGEDLCAAIFKHYCEFGRKSRINILDSNLLKPTTTKRKGKWLDRWIIEDKNGESILYQTEIKSWCSRAIGGVNVPLDTDKDVLDRLAEINWLHHMPSFSSREGNGLNKVLIDMVSDRKLNLAYSYRKEPLLILWNVAKPREEMDFFFKYNLPEKHFHYDYCLVFSCSLYLRRLYESGKSEIIIDMPNVSRRLKQLNQIFKV